MHAKHRLVSVVGLGAALSAGLFAQSIIEYGQGVGRAGAAGAASGTGIAGIFSKVKDTTEDDKTKKRSHTKIQSREELTANEHERNSAAPGNAPLKMKTSSGVVVSGVSPTWMGAAHREPLGEPVRVKSVDWSNPAEENAAAEQGGEAAGGTQTEMASGAGATQASAKNTATENQSAARVVAGGNSFGEPSGQGSVEAEEAFGTAPQLEAVTDAEIAGVRIGSRIDEVIQALGRPTFAFTGLTGRSYTEKYVFKNAEGDTITVLTWAGVVTSVLVI